MRSLKKCQKVILLPKELFTQNVLPKESFKIFKKFYLKRNFYLNIYTCGMLNNDNDSRLLVTHRSDTFC